MGLRSCFVPGCSTGYSSTKRRNKKLGLRNKSLFKAISEQQLLMWRKAIPRKDKVLRGEDRVCELHFSRNDILHFFESVMPDGSIHRIERGSPTVKPDAVPINFPNLPCYLSKSVKTRKVPTKREMQERPSPLAEEIDRPEFEENIFENLNLLANTAVTSKPVLESACAVDDFSMYILTKSLDTIKLPSPSWTSALVGSSVVFLYVGKNFLTEKTLVISEDLGLKVIVQRQIVDVEDLKEIRCLEDLLENINVIYSITLVQSSSV